MTSMEQATAHASAGGDNARFCLAEAHVADARGDWHARDYWVVKSLAYSVGILHEDHTRAQAAFLWTYRTQ